MASADADGHDEQEKDAWCGKSYGTTYIGDGSHAHLGDVLQNINLSGEVHLHIHNLRRTVTEPERVQDVRRTCRLSLQALRNVLKELCDRLGDNAHQTPESRCVLQLATRTVTEIDAVLDAETQHETRPGWHIRRPKNQTNTKKYTQKKLELFCRNVEDRLNMIKYLIDAQHDDKAKLEPSSLQSGAKTVTALDGSKHDTNVIKLKLVLALPKLELSKADLYALLARFNNEVMALWTATSAVFMICCYRLSIYLPQIIPVCLMLTRLPRLLALGDTFTFYDASNTKAELSVADFSHWDIFRTRLECKFRGTPGEDTVLGGNYILTGSHMNDLVINASNWQGSIKEGIIIYMAANVLRRQEETDRCPRCQAESKLKAKFHPSGNACAKCGLASLQLMITNSSVAAQQPHSSDIAASSPMSVTPASSLQEDLPNIASQKAASDPLSIFNRINVNVTRSRPTASLNFLRDNPQFQQLRRVVQQEPQMLEPILQQVQAGNPQLAQLIASNPEEFLTILAEIDEDDQESNPQQPNPSVLEEERAAIERLCRLGFERDLVIQAYFACDKDEDLAATFLFDQPHDDEPELSLEPEPELDPCPSPPQLDSLGNVVARDDNPGNYKSQFYSNVTFDRHGRVLDDVSVEVALQRRALDDRRRREVARQSSASAAALPTMVVHSEIVDIDALPNRTSPRTKKKAKDKRTVPKKRSSSFSA